MISTQAGQSKQVIDLNNFPQDFAALQPKITKLSVNEVLAQEVKPNQKIRLSFSPMDSNSPLARLSNISVENRGSKAVQLEALLPKAVAQAMRSDEQNRAS
ncbi:MAG TPA: hypothetical protein DHW71_01885 [Gammaproteobacteria bacterium]|nr:hypothetical protein [Gammaproteobacteria bacterium]MEC8011035.1 hypothetical protein [Pseudomonadota bacterium]HBF08484.1 hypothetical protein [Gammaproteobacteria bacterium]HCK91704.1 hypothetical protein [Gammaproteobacteria bacterium]